MTLHLFGNIFTKVGHEKVCTPKRTLKKSKPNRTIQNHRKIKGPKKNQKESKGTLHNQKELKISTKRVKEPKTTK